MHHIVVLNDIDVRVNRYAYTGFYRNYLLAFAFTNPLLFKRFIVKKNAIFFTELFCIVERKIAVSAKLFYVTLPSLNVYQIYEFKKF